MSIVAMCMSVHMSMRMPVHMSVPLVRYAFCTCLYTLQYGTVTFNCIAMAYIAMAYVVMAISF